MLFIKLVSDLVIVFQPQFWKYLGFRDRKLSKIDAIFVIFHYFHSLWTILDIFCPFLIPTAQIFWKLWLIKVYYIGFQLHKQLKRDLRGSNAPHVQEVAIFTIFYHFHRFWTIFAIFLSQNPKCFENCNWKTFNRSGSNFINNISKISEVSNDSTGSRRHDFYNIPPLFSPFLENFGQFLAVFDPQSPNILTTVAEKVLLGRVPTL